MESLTEEDQPVNLPYLDFELDDSFDRVTKFIDDPSLPAPSSTIRFRNVDTTTHVYPDTEGQFIIEDGEDKEGNRTMTVKRFRTETIAAKALRATYTLVTLFWVSRKHLLT
jgi:hypothetical protein